MNYTKSKKTQRFEFTVARNTKSHQPGANTFTISTDGQDSKKYSYGPTEPATVTMTVKEAKALQRFLNNSLVQ